MARLKLTENDRIRIAQRRNMRYGKRKKREDVVLGSPIWEIGNRIREPHEFINFSEIVASLPPQTIEEPKVQFIPPVKIKPKTPAQVFNDNSFDSEYPVHLSSGIFSQIETQVDFGNHAFL